ncbi:superoxide dismutase [Syncephalis plumigaleata]|nr:superoxide dismutase [Syncephalis plumigaleata]
MMGMKALLCTGLLALALVGSTAMARPSPDTTPASAPATSNNSDALIKKGDVEGFILFVSSLSATTVFGGVTIGNLPAGEYSYHVHEKPVPENGDCAATGGHYDPHAKKGAKCTKTTLTDCEIGDLSGKFGKLDNKGKSDKKKDDKEEAMILFEDPTLKLSNGANGIVGRSIVIHNPAGDRIACGNIVDNSFNLANMVKK